MPTFDDYFEKIVVNEKFALYISEILNPKDVAPLLCAGIISSSPLRHWKIDKGSHIEVVGLIGLRHMVLKVVKGLG